VDRLTATAPRLRVEEAEVASGGPWGSTFIDKSFHTVLLEVLGPWGGRIPPHLLQDAVSTMVQAKLRPDRELSDHVVMRVRPWLNTLSGAPDFPLDHFAMLDLVEAYNERNGLHAWDAFVYDVVSCSLVIPGSFIISTINTTVRQITSHLAGRLEPGSAGSAPVGRGEVISPANAVGTILLVGGFANSPLLVDVSQPACRARRHWAASQSRALL
jgi:hypothetical protein